MGKILLIDADSKIPNIALMKLSTFHEANGDEVHLVRLRLPYFPNKKKTKYIVPTGYTKTYCSVVFEGNKGYVKGKEVVFGGTGVDLVTVLPDKIENLPCDYSLYPENDTSYGFITRGCIRKCTFCKVPVKEGGIRKVSNVGNIKKHRKVAFLDNNILAYSEHKAVFMELIEKKIRCNFNQGLDIRLLDCENSALLSKLNYMREYVFAFDHIKHKKLISEKLLLLGWRKDWQLKFFVYINPEMALSDTVERIEYLKTSKCLPYVMRDISCWDSVNSDFYIDIAAYCNQVHLFKKLSFDSFLIKRHTNAKRAEKSSRLYNENI